MKKYYETMFWASEGTLILSIIDIVSRNGNSPWIIILVLLLGILLIANDLYRNYKMNLTSKRAISVLFSLAGSIIILLFDRGFVIFYFFSFASEGLYQKKPWNKVILTLHFLCYEFLLILREFYRYSGEKLFDINKIAIKNVAEIVIFTLFYLLSVFSFYATRELQIKKWEAEKLNRELQENNIKLKEYSEKIEMLTISKERDRVASELHDTLGHSLTALIMYLDFLEKMLDSDTNRAMELTRKTQGIARDSMDVLRKAVYALKEDSKFSVVSEALQELVDNITAIEGITVDYVNKGEIESAPTEHKSVIYKIVQESITNGLKHGKATHFDICISVDNNIKVVVKNDGWKCTSIQKGNGLLGIEERVWNLHGSVSYLNNNDGFGIDVFIPVEEVTV